jgi:hypothetical protein
LDKGTPGFYKITLAIKWSLGIEYNGTLEHWNIGTLELFFSLLISDFFRIFINFDVEKASNSTLKTEN